MGEATTPSVRIGFAKKKKETRVADSKTARRMAQKPAQHRGATRRDGFAREKEGGAMSASTHTKYWQQSPRRAIDNAGTPIKGPLQPISLLPRFRHRSVVYLLQRQGWQRPGASPQIFRQRGRPVPLAVTTRRRPDRGNESVPGRGALHKMAPSDSHWLPGGCA